MVIWCQNKRGRTGSSYVEVNECNKRTTIKDGTCIERTRGKEFAMDEVMNKWYELYHKNIRYVEKG